MIENYSVTLEKELVEKAKEILKPHGGKLSPIINDLLKQWVDYNLQGEQIDG